MLPGGFFEVVRLAARITDRKKKKIVADYLELGSYNAVAKLNGVCRQTEIYPALDVMPC